MRSAWRKLAGFAAVMLLTLQGWWLVGPVWADSAAPAVTYVCDGVALTATLHSGAVDDPTIPNSTGGTFPGAFVVLQSPERSLQLPRTNNAGAPSFTDGQWWWSLEDPDHPRFLRRRGLGDVQTLACERQQAPMSGS